MNKMIGTAILLVATFVTTSVWAGDSSHKSGKVHLDCVQTDSSHAKNNSGKIHLECVQSKQHGKDSKHEYHEKTNNPED